MGESSICSPDPKKLGDKEGDASLFPRRIHFHPARKPFMGFTNNNPNFHLQTLNPTSGNTHKSPSGNTTSTEITLRSKPSSADPFEHGGFDPELCFGITVRRIGAGLENLGNTCFLNSVLQCLTYTEPFAAYLQSGKHKSSCHTAGFCAMCAIQNHVKRALTSTGRILAPKDLVVNLRCISRNFRNARQEDAHEYMVNLLESMHKCCLPSGVPSESPSAYEKSLVHKIFGGRLRSQVKCMQCSYCSDTFDPFLDLSLEINKADSLHKALAHFTAVEQLDGGQRQYQCQRCKQKVKALKQLTVHKAPFVLSIHLKRFGSHVPGQKIDKKVEFGPTLDLKSFVSGSYEGNLKYTLYGVLVHAGWSTHSGHYYCFVRTSTGMWHNLDDNRVVQVSEKTVLQQKAYMLFYVRDRQSLAPRKPIDRKENSLPRVIKDTENHVSDKKLVQNGPVPTGLCSSDLSKRTQLENSSGKITTGSVVMTGNSSQLKDSVSRSSAKAQVNGGVIQSTNGPSLEVHPQSVLLSVERSNPSSHPVPIMSGTKTDLEHLHQGSNALHVPPSFVGSQNSGPKKPVINNATTKMVDVITNTGTSGAESAKTDTVKFEKKISARLSTESGSENSQKEAVVSEHFHQKPDGNSSTSKKTRLAQMSGKSCKGSGKEDDYHPSLQKVLKPKKTMKLRMTNMHPGSGFLMKASLSLYKRKKQKRNKPKNSGLKSDIHESSGGLEPSTSQKTRSIDLASAHSKKRPRKSTAEKRSGQMRSKDIQAFKEESMGSKGIQTPKEKSVVPEDDLKERIYQKNAVFGSNELPQKSCIPASEETQSVLREPDTSRVKRGMIENGLSSDEKHSVSREPDNSRMKRGLFENGLMSVLTRGLEEFTVARWDDTEPPSQDLESKGGQSLNIGYVPDEWDEEYDRGKRKKLRKSKDDFGGSNPFQEMASKKEKLKKSKVDRFGSGNQPLRIR